MKTASEVTADKLRGGFYSPDDLVRVCLDRALELLQGRTAVRVLEPSAGDGSFIRGLSLHPLGALVESVTAIELMPEAAAEAQAALARAPFRGRVTAGSVLGPATLSEAHDVAIGNPPFVRFQFLTTADRRDVEVLGERIGVPFAGVSNLWIPVLLSALSNLSDGGIFSFIVPAECFTGLSARVVRNWLLGHARELKVDLFPPRSFPDVLQEVVVLSGRANRIQSLRGATVAIHDHGVGESWVHALDEKPPTWTGLLLRPPHLEALAEVSALDAVQQFGKVAKLSVSTVTGANGYFCVDEPTRCANELEEWTRPLLDRIRHAPGLEYTTQDHERNRAAGRPVWLIDSTLSTDTTPGAKAYIESGEARNLHKRYKTRIRNPWWKVPVITPGSLMLSKRSNEYPRLILNGASVTTTDTIYQGSPLPSFEGRESEIVGSFHNSLTLLTAELFGRSFGGGVLELVPSEIAQLLLPLSKLDELEFATVDALMRSATDADDVVVATDAVVRRCLKVDPPTWELLHEARCQLRDRRLSRN